MTKTITISEFDRRRLFALVDGYEADAADRGTIQDLLDEIERANVVPPAEIPPEVITMNTRLRLADAKSGESRVVTVVFPGSADSAQGKISILAPLGTALLGYSVGDVVEWRVPAGLRHYRIESIEYQPEAAGDWKS